MWTARITILVLLLLTGGGWFDALLQKWKKRTILFLLPVVFGLTFVPEFRTQSVRLCFAPCLFALLTAALCPTDHPIAALIAAVLGGLIGRKLCDALPMFPEQGVLVAVPALLLAALYCRDANAKALAIAAAPFMMLLFQMFDDYLLFRSTVLELGSADAFAAQTTGLLFLLLGGGLLFRFRRFAARRFAPA